MNIFDSILGQSTKDKFLGKPKQPSFLDTLQQPQIQPQAHRTSLYVAPKPTQIQTTQVSQTPNPTTVKPSITLFADEQNAYNVMKQDGLSDDEAFGLVKQRREQLASGLKLTPIEQSALKQMASDGLGAEEALSLLAQGRKLQKDTAKADFEDKYAKGNVLQKGVYNALMLGAGATEKVLQYGGNILDFATFGKAGFGEDVKKMQEVAESPEFDSTAFKAGKILPDVALAVSPIGGGYLAGAKGVGSLALRSGVVGAGFGASTPILEKGSEATAQDIGKGALVGGAISAGTAGLITGAQKLAPSVKRAGKALYKTAIKPTADEARVIIGSEAQKLAVKEQAKAINASKKLSPATKAKKIASLEESIKVPTLRADTALKYGITGTEKGIGVKGTRKADKIWQETIQPAINKSKATHSIDDIFTKAEQQIAGEKSALRKQELMEGLQALKEDYLATGKKVFTTGDLQAEKSMLDEFTPTKVFKGKEVAQGYNQVKNTIANIMRQQVRDDLGKAGVKNAKELYRDWANLKALEDIGVKGITEGGLKGGFGTFWSTLYDKLATPVKTVGGKVLYKTGEGLEFVGPKGLKTVGDFLKSKGYKVSGDSIINLSKNAKPTLIRSGILLGNSNSGMDGDTVKNSTK